jgi:hypothetical protein
VRRAFQMPTDEVRARAQAYRGAQRTARAAGVLNEALDAFLSSIVPA